MPELLTWDLESEMTPGDFLIGHVLGEHKGDEESVQNATLAMLAATFKQAGLDTDAAVDKAMEAMEAGLRIGVERTAESTSLTFDLKYDDDE